MIQITTQTPREYRIETSVGNIPGTEGLNIFGRSEELGAVEKLVWDQGGIYTFLTADTTIFASSSNNSDTQTILITGTDFNRDAITQSVVLTGQTAKALVTDMFRINSMLNVSSTTMAGDVFLSIDDTDLVAGVPQTQSNIVGFIKQDINVMRAALFSVPNGKMLVSGTPRIIVDKNFDVTITAVVKPRGIAPLKLTTFHSYQSEDEINLYFPTPIFAGADLSFVGTASNENSKASAGFDTVLISV